MQRTENVDGLEMMFATNYLGHFLLTNLLFGSLRATKVITTSGSSHKASVGEGLNTGTIDLDNLQGEKEFNFAQQSKQVVLAKILFTYELARKWAKYDISVCTLSPGLVKTNLVRQLPWYVQVYFNLRCALMRAKTLEAGAQHYLELVTRDDINEKYFEADSGELLEAHSSDESYDEVLAEKLWKVSEKLIGQSFVY
jgi:NAD(P)-dependent dehydrogenase (short-subunit alcohol dehydrogenase family)